MCFPVIANNSFFTNTTKWLKSSLLLKNTQYYTNKLFILPRASTSITTLRNSNNTAIALFLNNFSLSATAILAICRTKFHLNIGIHDFELTFMATRKKRVLKASIGNVPPDKQLSKLTDLIRLTSFNALTMRFDYVFLLLKVVLLEMSRVWKFSWCTYSIIRSCLSYLEVPWQYKV